MMTQEEIREQLQRWNPGARLCTAFSELDTVENEALCRRAMPQFAAPDTVGIPEEAAPPIESPVQRPGRRRRDSVSFDFKSVFPRPASGTNQENR